MNSPSPTCLRKKTCRPLRAASLTAQRHRAPLGAIIRHFGPPGVFRASGDQDTRARSRKIRQTVKPKPSSEGDRSRLWRGPQIGPPPLQSLVVFRLPSRCGGVQFAPTSVSTSLPRLASPARHHVLPLAVLSKDQFGFQSRDLQAPSSKVLGHPGKPSAVREVSPASARRQLLLVSRLST